MRVAFSLDCRNRGEADDAHLNAKLLQYWCSALEDFAVFGSTRFSQVSVSTLFSTGFKVWISFEETCTLETLRRVLPQLISTSMQSDNGRRETEHEGAVEFLRSFIEWFAAAPKVATKLVLLSLDLARWVAAFSSLHDFTSRRRIDTRGFSFDLLSIECVEVTSSLSSHPINFCSPIVEILQKLSIFGDVKQVALLHTEFLQLFRALITTQERVQLSVKGFTLAVGHLTRLSVRETPHPRPSPYILFDVRSRAAWTAIPQQAIWGVSMLVRDGIEECSAQQSSISALAETLDKKEEVLILRAPLDPQTFESLPEELGIRHLFVAHPQAGSTPAELLIQGLLSREYFLCPSLRQPPSAKIQAERSYKAAQAALESLGMLELYNPVLYSCRTAGTAGGISAQQATYFAEVIECHAQKRKRTSTARRPQAGLRLTCEPADTCRDRLEGTDSNKGRIPEDYEQTLAVRACPPAEHRCINQRPNKKPNKPQQLCTLLRNVFDTPTDAAKRGN